MNFHANAFALRSRTICLRSYQELPGAVCESPRAQKWRSIKKEENSMRGFGSFVGFVALICLMPLRATAADMSQIVPMLQKGGYVLVLRHGATDESQKDVYPFVFDDMKKQRQLSDQGRDVARKMGSAIKTLGIPIGQIYSSKLNRA
jgi:bisphosphoglycerate-dependent phosphoglycerate mutase